MSHLLVVDDSPMDRRLVGQMLEDQTDCEVEYAADGKEALEQMQARLPAAVITDLQMPNLDGMQLVEAIRRQFVNVPVILITAHGSEETARQALSSGAADYVPKSKLASRLLPSVEGVLAIAASDRARHQLARCVRYQEVRYELENDVSLIPPLVDHLRQVAVDLGLIDETDGMRMAKALAEAIRNAMYHGNLELPLGGCEDGDQLSPGDADLIAIIRDHTPYSERRIHLHATFSSEEARFVIRDEGPGFNTVDVPDVEADPSLLTDGGGHGLVLIRMFMDEVTFNATGNEVTMVKRARPKERARGAAPVRRWRRGGDRTIGTA
jgi:CheY-like chemotaxis protein